MKNRQRRLKVIELSLPPKQVVLVWLRNAAQGTLEEGARHSPPYRGMVANAVYENVRNAMKGQPEELVAQAVLQARREADLLYLLVVNANTAAFEQSVQGEREYTFLLGYLIAEARGHLTKDQLENLRLAFLTFIESVIGLDSAIAQLVAEHLNGQPVLFRDTAVKLAEQLKLATKLSTWFNTLAVAVGAAEIDMEQVRNSLQPGIERQVSIWASDARVKMLALFGTIEEVRAAMDQAFLLLER